MGPIHQNTKLGYKNSVKGKKYKTQLARKLRFFVNVVFLCSPKFCIFALSLVINQVLDDLST